MRGIAVLAMTFASHPALAQTAQLNIDSLDQLASRAAQVVNVTIDEQLLQLASKFLSPDRSPDEKEVLEIVKQLKGVYVKRFEFDTDGAYSEADLEPIRTQLRVPGWSRIVSVATAKEAKDVDVFIMTEGSIVKGISVVVAQPRELTVVNVVGPIDIDRLSRLSGQFGIPPLGLKGDGSPGR
jgi:hypothetical protein